MTSTRSQKPKTACAPLPAAALAVSPRELSRAEMRVLHQIILGRTTPQIAARLGNSAETVKTHRESIMRKLGASNIAQAIAVAYSSGVLSPDSLGRMQQMEELRAGAALPVAA